LNDEGERNAGKGERIAMTRGLGYPGDDAVRTRRQRALPNGKRLRSSTLARAVLDEMTFNLPADRDREARTMRQVLSSNVVRVADC
jgi:hypothetical protein